MEHAGYDDTLQHFAGGGKFVVVGIILGTTVNQCENVLLWRENSGKNESDGCWMMEYVDFAQS